MNNMNKQEQYQQASETVENILDNNYVHLETTINNSFVNIPYKFKKQFYSHMNTLFLNVLLNRLNEFNNYKEVEKRTCKSREIICKIITNIENE